MESRSSPAEYSAGKLGSRVVITAGSTAASARVTSKGAPAYEHPQRPSRMSPAACRADRHDAIEPRCHDGAEIRGIVEDQVVPGVLHFGELAAVRGSRRAQHGVAVHDAAALAAHYERGTQDAGEERPGVGPRLGEDAAVEGVAPDAGFAFDHGRLTEMADPVR